MIGFFKLGLPALALLFLSCNKQPAPEAASFSQADVHLQITNYYDEEAVSRAHFWQENDKVMMVAGDMTDISIAVPQDVADTTRSRFAFEAKDISDGTMLSFCYPAEGGVTITDGFARTFINPQQNGTITPRWMGSVRKGKHSSSEVVLKPAFATIYGYVAQGEYSVTQAVLETVAGEKIVGDVSLSINDDAASATKSRVTVRPVSPLDCRENYVIIPFTVAPVLLSEGFNVTYTLSDGTTLESVNPAVATLKRGGKLSAKIAFPAGQEEPEDPGQEPDPEPENPEEEGGEPTLFICGGNKIYHLKTNVVINKNYNTSGGTLWQWSSDNTNDHIDECKLVNSGTQVLATCSNNGGWCKIIDYKTKRVVFNATSGVNNAHSACLLPGNRVAVACSVGTDAVVVFDINNPKTVLCKAELPSAHGVYYSALTGCLYAIGETYLRVYTLTGWDTTSPSLKASKSLSTASYVRGCHDLNYVNTTTLSVAGNAAALFNIQTYKFTPVGIFGSVNSPNVQVGIKSFNYNPTTKEAWYTYGGDAEYDWATHVIRHTADAMSESGTQNAKITANGMNVYKVRVVHF